VNPPSSATFGRCTLPLGLIHAPCRTATGSAIVQIPFCSIYAASIALAKSSRGSIGRRSIDCGVDWDWALLFLFGTFDLKPPTCFSLVHICPSFGALCSACLYSLPGSIDVSWSGVVNPETYISFVSHSLALFPLYHFTSTYHFLCASSLYAYSDHSFEE
jgi:hypothetical protein